MKEAFLIKKSGAVFFSKKIQLFSLDRFRLHFEVEMGLDKSSSRVSKKPFSFKSFLLHFSTNSVGTRVTRLGDYSRIGRLFTLGSFINTQLAHIFGHLFPW
jgi:hypothetical protein